MLEEVAERLRRHDAQVEAEPVARDDRRLRVALRRDVDDPRQAREVAGQLGGIGRARDDVEVAERLLAPPHRPGLRDARSPPAARAAPRRPPAPRAGRRRAGAGPVSGLSAWNASAGEDLLLALRARARQASRSRSDSAAALSSSSVSTPSSLPDARRGLRPEARQLHEEDDLGRDAGLASSSAPAISPISTISTIFSSIVLPMPCSSFARPSSASCATEPDVSRIARGRAAVRDDAERVLRPRARAGRRGGRTGRRRRRCGGSAATPAMI